MQYTPQHVMDKLTRGICGLLDESPHDTAAMKVALEYCKQFGIAPVNVDEARDAADPRVLSKHDKGEFEKVLEEFDISSKGAS